MAERSGRWVERAGCRAAFLSGALACVAGGAWGLGWWSQGGRDPGALPADYLVGAKKPVLVRPGVPRELPWWHRDMELTGRVRVPRGKHLDLVFRLQPGPATTREEDRTAPLGPREWSALRLSAADVGPPFFDARTLPEGSGGARVAPDQPTDIRLVVRRGGAQAEVGHEPLEDRGRVWADRGVLALVGEGTVETLRVRALARALEPSSLAVGLGLALGAAVLGGLLGRVVRATFPGLFLGALLAAGLGLFLGLAPGRPADPGWDPAAAPSFERAQDLYGGPDGFRNWGSYAGLVTWRGRTDFQGNPAAERRVLVLGGAQAWGVGVPVKEGTFALQAEGLLGRRRTQGEPAVALVVAACRTTNLPRQIRLLEEDLGRFEAAAVLLVCPPEVLGRPGPSLELLGSLVGRLREKRLGFCVVPPLVPAATPGLERFRADLDRHSREQAYRVCDPTQALAAKAGTFLDPEGERLPDLSPTGHQVLGALIAGHLEEVLGP